MAKSSKIKVPKRVAGVKIPKSVRKGPALQFVNSPAGKLLVAEALTAALAMFAYKQTQGQTMGENGEKLKHTAHDAEDALKRNTARLTHAFGEAVRAFREALASYEPPSLEGEESEASGDAPLRPPKKSPRRPPENLSQL
jgi:hypothetical protein